MPAPPVDERLICQVWQGQHLNVDALCTGDGQPVQVVYRGRPSSDFGPDFRGAIISLGNGRLLRGDVEVHVRASDWHAHGHDRDPRYNGVVLHVVFWADTPDTALESGTHIPLLALSDCLESPLAELAHRLRPPTPARPCREVTGRLGPLVGVRIDRLGDERFARKAAVFEGALACRPPVQVLYEGLMEALGYRYNRGPFVEVARRLPLATLEGLLWGKPPERQARLGEALLLGAAGLLPAQRALPLPLGLEDRRRALELEGIWREHGGEAVVDEGDWRFGGVRPENYPPRRLAGAAGLVARSLAEGLLERTLDAIREPGRDPAPGLEAVFAVPADGYWAHRYDFGRPARAAGALVGGSRARIMGLDVALPFALALAAGLDDGTRQDLVWRAYRAYPRLSENEVTREATRQLFGQARPDVVNSARRQQGLLHLRRVYCEEGRCLDCPLATE